MNTFIRIHCLEHSDSLRHLINTNYITQIKEYYDKESGKYFCDIYCDTRAGLDAVYRTDMELDTLLDRLP